ncbi:hypothetical protein FACS1894181_12090 [Bacteroidia bacterium]|nr:hypothetical protein FACS1894181_12090 [Bacteroidia bacterium]
MKKVVMMFAFVSLIVSFVACGGKKAEKAEGGSDVLAKYEAFVDKAVTSGLIEKIIEGDMGAFREWTKLVSSFNTLGQEIQNEIGNFTPEQNRKFQELTQKWADYAAKAASQ